MFAISSEDGGGDKSPIKENLSDILSFLEKSLKETTEFAKEQIPIFIQEIINYYLLLHGSIALFALIAFIFAIKIGNRYINKASSYNVSTFGDDDPIGLKVPAVLSYVFCVPAAFTFFHNFYEFIKLWVAPRLYLIEYIKDMM